MRSPIPKFPRCLRQILDLQAFLLVLVVWSALALLVGCQSGPADPVVDNDDPEVGFSWFPELTAVGLTQGQEQLFRVFVSGATDLSATWTLGAATVGTGDSFTYEASDPGQETLSLDVTAGGATKHREWIITVGAVVTGISILHGDEPGEVVVQWNPIPEGGTVEPVTQYLVGVSYSGPITEENWPDATQLGSFAAGEIFYEEAFTTAQGIVPGAEAWFNVRGLDALGGMTPIIGEFGFEISFPWYIDGYLRDDADQPLSGIIVSYRDGCAECRVNSDASGHYRIGPLFNFDTVDLETTSSDLPPVGEPYTSWYDLRWPTFGYDGNETMLLDIHLLTRYGLDDGCVAVDYAGDFLAYLCRMTNNQVGLGDRRLFTWAEYPISIYVPLFMGPNDFDLGLATREMPLLWNTLLGEEFFVLVDDPDLADVVFRFPYPDDPDYDLGGTRLGYTKVIEPLSVELGETIPVKMRVSVEPTLQMQLAQEVGLHELGHVLGYAAHSSCPDARYLMNYSPAGALDYGPENAIHVDELRAVRAIRYLPQAVDMSIFESDLE